MTQFTKQQLFEGMQSAACQNKLNKLKHKEILEVCKGHEQLMWSAKIISILLGCDFRDSKQKLEEYLQLK